jgi:hypothetical protein
MKNIYKYYLLVVTLFIFVFAHGNVFAQEEDLSVTNQTKDDDNASYQTPEEYFEEHPEELEQKDGIKEIDGGVSDWANNNPGSSGTNCFDYYKFQSVTLSFDEDNDLFGPGETIHFFGNIVNSNDYPIANGLVFARISRVSDRYITDGNNIVDEIIAIDNVNLKAKEVKEASFDWNAPKELVSGEYRIDFFFSVGKKFNLGGLPFTNEVVAGFDTFTINSDDVDYVYFDRAGTKVNGKKYNHMSSWPFVEYGKEAVVTQPIISTFPDGEPVKVSYDLYAWDSLNEKDLISHTEEMITVANGNSSSVSFTIPKMSKSVYYLKITLNWRHEKSIVNIRIVSDGNNPRLNFPALTKFPIKQGDEFTLFSCFHNASGMNTKGGVEVTLSDKGGNEVGKIEYNGDITSAMMADKVDLKADKDYDFLKLKAKIFNANGLVVDDYEVVYDKCDFEDCSNVGNDTQKNEQANEQFKLNTYLILFILLLTLSIGVIVLRLKAQKKDEGNKDDNIIQNN